MGKICGDKTYFACAQIFTVLRKMFCVGRFQFVLEQNHFAVTLFFCVMALDSDSTMAGTVIPNFCHMFANIKSSYEEKDKHVLDKFFAYLDDYITLTRSQMDYATSTPDQEEVRKICFEAISLLREPFCYNNLLDSTYFGVFLFV